MDEPSCPSDLTEAVDRADLAGAVAAGDAVDLGRVEASLREHAHEIADRLVLDCAVEALHEFDLVGAFLLLARAGGTLRARVGSCAGVEDGLLFAQVRTVRLERDDPRRACRSPAGEHLLEFLERDGPEVAVSKRCRPLREVSADVLPVLLRPALPAQILEEPADVFDRHVHGLRRASGDVLATGHVPGRIAPEECQLRERFALRSDFERCAIPPPVMHLLDHVDDAAVELVRAATGPRSGSLLRHAVSAFSAPSRDAVLVPADYIPVTYWRRRRPIASMPKAAENTVM
jgi:hypothetical protein